MNTKKAKARQKLDKLVKQSDRRLMTIEGVFPFDFFPDKVHIDENKIQIVYRKFFLEEQVVPVLYPTIISVRITTNSFFGTMELKLQGFEANPYKIKLLRHEDAVRAKRLILGMIACDKEKIDLSRLPLDEVRQKVEEVGRSQEHTDI